MTAPSPRISSTTAFQITSILGLASARSTMICEARNSSRRCTIVTLLANFVRNVASSIAVSPPPTTTSSRSRKKKPSQVAQALTPRPRSFSSPGTFSHFALAPGLSLFRCGCSLHIQPHQSRKGFGPGHPCQMSPQPSRPVGSEPHLYVSTGIESRSSFRASVAARARTRSASIQSAASGYEPFSSGCRRKLEKLNGTSEGRSKAKPSSFVPRSSGMNHEY